MAGYGITLPMLNVALPRMASLITSAEQAGFRSVHSYEFYRSPYIGLAQAAAVTDRIKLGTGVAVALTRTPFVTANAAADVDELSGGRMVLGLGTGDLSYLAAFHGIQLSQPVNRMREYIEAVRAGWRWLAGGKPEDYKGEFYEFSPLQADLFGRRPMVRDRIPIYLAALGPKMAQLAGEVADGLLGAFLSIPYLKDVVEPNLAIGARRAGRDLRDVVVSSETICCVSRDRAEALRRARIQVGFYAAYYPSPFLRAAGLEKEQRAVRATLRTEGPKGLEKVTDDKLIEYFSITGTPDECRQQVKVYEEHLTLPVFHVPYVPPLTAEETEDVFHSILDAFGD